MAQKKNITKYWEENHWLHDCCLCYSDSKGLYSSNNTIPLSTEIFYQAHGYMGYYHDIIEINGLRIRFDSNFGYGNSSYLRATVEKKGQRLLDFDTSKLFVLNHCSVATFDVNPYEWSSLFDKIIVASNNFNPELCSTKSITYIEKMRDILISDSVRIKGSFAKEKEVVWDGDIIVTLLVSDKTKDLLDGLKSAHVSDRITIEYTLKLCRDLLAKFHLINPDITDIRTKRLSDTLFLIHQFMYENDRGLDFFDSFVGDRRNIIDTRT